MQDSRQGSDLPMTSGILCIEHDAAGSRGMGHGGESLVQEIFCVRGA